ncbi:serine protease [Pedobacter caeni]|uniref:Trypsin n=1 Tax=Pedobacter caeni TaxID=288992 RepID=A0A1M4VDF9_9SPHI|nr:serine protease [Pedobacter caeni]SHE66870.1 Trypsin [Pedobacter caeni]
MKKTIISLSLILALSIYFIGCKKKDLPENQQEKKVNDKTSIIGGEPINILNAPYQAAFFVHKGISFGFQGGGVILSENWILTAAHVVSNGSQQLPLSLVNVRTGSTDANLGTNRTVDQIIRHPNYNPTTLENDIALVHLSSPMTFNASTAAISYSTSTSIPYAQAGYAAIASGWGDTVQSGIGSSTNQLNSVGVKVIPNNDGSIPGYMNRSESILFTNSPDNQNHGTCNGDSGGPLTINFGDGPVLAGIVSFGTPTCLNGPAGYARVSYFADWIYTNSGVGSDRLYGNYGINYFCGSANYQIVQPSTGTTVSWSVSNPSNATLSTSTGNSVTVTRTGDLYADLNLTATITFPGGRTKVINKKIFSDCKVPIVVQALRGGMPRPLMGGVKFISNNPQNPREFGSDWMSVDEPEIVPGTYNLYAYLDNGVSVSVNVNGTSQNVVGQGVGSVGIGNGVFLGTVTVNSGFYVKAILP